MPVPRKVWLHTLVAMPAALARRCTIFQALMRCSRFPVSSAWPRAMLDGLQEGTLPASPDARRRDLVGFWLIIAEPRTEYRSQPTLFTLSDARLACARYGAGSPIS